MNAEQKQRAIDLIDVTKTYQLDAEECAMQMASLLQELIEPPKLSDERILELWANNSGRPVTMGKARIIAQARAIERELLGE